MALAEKFNSIGQTFINEKFHLKIPIFTTMPIYSIGESGRQSQVAHFNISRWRFLECSGMLVGICMVTLNPESYPDSIGFGRANVG